VAHATTGTVWCVRYRGNPLSTEILDLYTTGVF
jgi:hypothetical protein